MRKKQRKSGAASVSCLPVLPSCLLIILTSGIILTGCSSIQPAGPFGLAGPFGPELSDERKTPPIETAYSEHDFSVVLPALPEIEKTSPVSLIRGCLLSLPPFMNPIPEPSIMVTMPEDFMNEAGPPVSYRSVVDTLEQYIDESGYIGCMFYTTGNGIAIVLPMEQINSHGEPAEGMGRWSYSIERQNRSVGSFISNLFTPEDVYFRCLVVYISTEAPEISGTSSITFDDALYWQNSGQHRAWLDFASYPEEDIHCTVMAYLFSQPTRDHEKTFIKAGTGGYHKYVYKSGLVQEIRDGS
jgi:hypothetical protein